MDYNQVRYDTIWRRIKSDRYAAKLEGQFRESRDRLGNLNNWGSLSWLYPHATASKLTHHYGVEHNALHFLDADEGRESHRPSFRIASHALHWGHLPLSYAGCEGIIRAAHVDGAAKKTLEGILNEVVAFGNLSCRTEDHSESCPDAVLSGENPFELYKWISAWLVKRRWKKIWKAVKGLAPEADEERVKGAAIRALVCREDLGYELLSLCRLADYVPRDLQQAGTAWLTVDIEALWETSPHRADRAREWSLLEAARDYLEERFFTAPDAQLVHSLASRTIAQGLLSQGISRDNILSLVSASNGDDHYQSVFPPHHRKRLREIEDLTKGERLGRVWSHIGTFANVHIPTMTRLKAEDFFSGRSGQGRLSYPLNSNFSVTIEPPVYGSPDGPGPELQRVSVCLHHRAGEAPAPARPALDIALEARRRQRRLLADGAAASITSWLSQERVELRSRPVGRAAGRALVREEDQVRSLMRRLREHSALSPAKDPARLRRALSSLLMRQELPHPLLGRRVLELPWALTRSRAGKSLMRLLRDLALIEVREGAKEWRGSSLEAATAADQLLSDDPCSQRLIILGATALSEEGQPISEWDVLRLDLLKGRDWRLVAVECAVTRDGQKNSEDRDKLERLGEALDQRFSDLYEFQTRLATANGQEVSYLDARRGFTRT